MTPREPYVPSLVKRVLVKLEHEIRTAGSRAELLQLKENYYRVWSSEHDRLARDRWFEVKP